MPMGLLEGLLSMFGMGGQSEQPKREEPDLMSQLLPLLGMMGPQMSGANQSIPSQGVFGMATHPQYGESINKYAQEAGLNPKFIEAVMLAESRGNPRALSPVGAQGLMQLMPSTAAYLGVKNSNDPDQNIQGGVKYIKELTDKLGDDPALVAAGYNWGPGRAKRFVGQPYEQWGSKIPKETQGYIPRILAHLQGK